MTSFGRIVRLALRGIGREWHAGELKVLIAALVVAVASTTAVGFFTDRVERAMHSQAAELLAADIVLHSPQPIEAVFYEQARQLGLSTADTVSFRSVLLVDEQLELAEVKAVSSAYPLHGTLRVATQAYGEDQATSKIPAPGSVWLDSRLLSKLGLEVGDSVELGESRFRIGAVLSYEPDRGGDLFSIAPRVLMHFDDVPATNLVQPGSRVTYALLLAGAPASVQRFRLEAEPELGSSKHFHSVEEGRPELRTALARAEQFLGLSSLVAVLLAGAAIAVSSRRYVDRRLDTAALMRCLGANQRTITSVFSLQVLLVGLAASAVGCLLGLAAQSVLVEVFSSLLLASLPVPSFQPVVAGLLTGIITLAGFALPPMLRLRDVSPARVMRRDLGTLPPRVFTAYGFAFGALAVLVLWHAGNTKLALYVIGAAVATLVVLAGFAIVLVRALKTLRRRVGTAWAFGLANLSRRARGSVLQMVAFGLGFTMLLLLTIVRGDILDEWQRNLPPDAPNYFLINVQPAEVDALRSFLADTSGSMPALYPMVRGRLQHINDHSVSADDYTDPEIQRLATRQFNLSWATEPGPGNLITAGDWWQAEVTEPGQFSVEDELAQSLGIELGDRLSFDVGGQSVAGTVTSLRAVEWDSFDVNFFVVAPPALLQDQPATFISSFHLAADQRDVLVELVRRFPSVTVLDVDALVTKVRQIMEQAVVGVEYVFLFTLLAGVVVLVAAVQSTMDERRFETAIIRTLGGRRLMLWQGLASEFVTLGLLAGLVAAVLSSAVGFVVAREIFQLQYQGDAGVWIVGMLGGGLGTGLVGLLSARGAIEQSPLRTLREL